MDNKDKGVSAAEALEILKTDSFETFIPVMEKASALRKKHFGNKVTACSIINARCGNCSEDCAFCAQSSRSGAQIRKYGLVDKATIVDNADRAAENGASHYGIVTSGRAADGRKDLETICSAIGKIRGKGRVTPCASLGVLKKDSFRRLRDAGLERYHHNLETSSSYFGKICSTRDFETQVRTVVDAKEAGLSVCSGGIFGLGESLGQRIELLDEIRRLGVDSVPLNFLNPVKGTVLENMKELTPLDCLKIIAAARLMMPDKTVRVCGGREHNLRDFQSWIFCAGADALMVGGYLVTAGRPVETDLQMIKDAGMELVSKK